jgi:dipeptidyl aminopeptidase/acylaminoacyl peptidase
VNLTLVAAAVALVFLLAPGCAASSPEPTGKAPEPKAPQAAERLPEVRGEGKAPSDDATGAAGFARYLAVRGQSGAAVSPGGDRVAFLESTTGMPQVWLVDRPMGWPLQITHFADRATGVRWTPAGDRLLVSGDVGGDERNDLLLVRPDGTQPRVLARGAEGRNEPGGFTPDGASLVMASTRRHAAHHDLWIVETGTGEARPLHESDFMNMAGDVSPDGTKAIAIRVHSSFESEIAVVDMATGERTRLLPDAPPADYEDAQWAPDGKSIYVRSVLGRDFLGVLRVPLDGGRPETVYAPEEDVDSLAVSEATGWLAWTVNDRGLSRLECFHPERGGKPRILLEGGRVGSPPAFAARAPVLVLGWGSARRPAAILRFDLGRTDPVAEEMTRPDLAGLDPASFVEPVERRFPSFDGTEISGFLYFPRSLPAQSCVVMVHGGPEGQYRPGFDPLVQLLVARGHAVFAPNVRGSTGYGRKFAKMDDGRKRMDSVKDLAAVHAHLVASGVAPKDRIAIMGGSYGGFMVLAALTHQPELWSAGIDIVGIAHLGTFLKNTGAYRQRHRAAEYGDPVKDADFFEETAPLRHADRIRVPLMVIQGKNDPRVPMSEAEQIVAAARANGAEVEYLLYPDEGHGLSKLKNRIEGYGKAADFLDRVLRRP